MSHDEMKHEGSMDMNKGSHMHGGHGHHKPWQSNWKSPTALGIFLVGAGIGFAAFIVGLQSFVALSQELRPVAASQAVSQQELQQMMQQAQSGANAAPFGH